MYPVIEKMHITANFTKADFEPKYIVLHDTGNGSKSADAAAHQRYFCDKTAKASYNYICDGNRIIECVPPGDAAWHAGVPKSGKRKDGRVTDITNYTSVAVSYCINDKKNMQRAIENAAFACAMLCYRLNLSELSVVRHYDSSGKNCPNTMYGGGSWDDFFVFCSKVGRILSEIRENAAIVNALYNKRYITDREYWLEVLCGQKNPEPRWIKVLLGRLCG